VEHNQIDARFEDPETAQYWWRKGVSDTLGRIERRQDDLDGRMDKLVYAIFGNLLVWAVTVGAVAYAVIER
jgi:hypothetical protein